MQQHLIMQMLLQQQQQQQQQQLSTNITTEHIQQYLDENKSLILKILESQNLGKFNECAENQARLQQNLLYLSTIADCKPPASPMETQLAQYTVTPPAARHMQQQQHTQQPFMPMLYGQQQQYSTSQHQHFLHGQLAMSSGGSSKLPMLPQEATAGSTVGKFPDFGCASAGEGFKKT